MRKGACSKAAGGLSRGSLGGVNLLPHEIRDRRRKLGRFALKLLALVTLGAVTAWFSALPLMREAALYTQQHAVLEHRLTAAGAAVRDTERLAEVLRQAQARRVLLAGFDALNRLSFDRVRLLVLHADAHGWVLHAAALDHAAAMQWVKHFKQLCPDLKIAVEAVHGPERRAAGLPGVVPAGVAAANEAIVFALHVRWPDVPAGLAGGAPVPAVSLSDTRRDETREAA